MQPTSTSCGPTCIAMYVGRPVREVMDRVRYVRNAERQRKRTFSTNAGEMIKLFNSYGFDLERRQNGDELREYMTALLRVHRISTVSGRHKSNWHWVLLVNGDVHDPRMHDPMDYCTWEVETRDHKVFFYPIVKRGA
jgi:hypothetical protein